MQRLDHGIQVQIHPYADEWKYETHSRDRQPHGHWNADLSKEISKAADQRGKQSCAKLKFATKSIDRSELMNIATGRVAETEWNSSRTRVG
jgi:hypothetical protein